MKRKKSSSKKHSVQKTHTQSYAHRKKHHKPYRVRHVSGLIVAFVICLASVLQVGIYIGKSSQSPSNLESVDSVYKSSLSAVRSSEGFSFGFDSELFSVEATEVRDGSARPVAPAELREGLAITSLTIKPVVSKVDAVASASRLNLNVVNNVSELASNDEFDIEPLSKSKETIGNASLDKTVYQYSPKFGQVKAKTYSVRWTGKIGNKNIIIHLEGLVEGSEIPSLYRSIFDTLSLNGEAKVLGLSTDDLPFLGKVYAQDKLDDKYLVDSLSPAVVKIYHIVCGIITVQGQDLTNNGCQASTGSGFIVSTDGYIATNGHVVVFDAKDAFVKFLVDNPAFLVEYLRGRGLTDSQISQLPNRPDILAALIAEIYTLPDDLIGLRNEKRTYLVSLGSDPVQFTKASDILEADKFKETDTIKKAKFIGADYSAQDIYTVSSGDENGFSASDVALLKADFDDAPFVALSSSNVTQSQKISIVGFPGDAENSLTDNSSLSVTVTNGAISSIRDAAGGKYKLFQSDADASRGNSGGPVFDDNGEVIGLLTYRFKNDAAVDAAKSYIRDVNDLKKLADDKDVELKTDGEVQGLWTDGLKLYSENRFSKAVKKFEEVKDLYPAHRLVNSYIANANKAIDEGRDVKDFPIIFVVLGVVGVGGVVLTVVLIARHRGHHQVYKANMGAGPMPPSPGAQMPGPQNPVVPGPAAPPAGTPDQIVVQQPQTIAPSQPPQPPTQPIQ